MTGGRWRHLAATSLVLAGMAAPLLGFGSARAQEAGTLSLAKITPADAAVYAEILLDPERDQIKTLDELLTKLGSDQSLVKSLTNVNMMGSTDIDLSGAEVAAVVLPSALQNQDSGSVFSDGLNGDTSAIATDVGNAASSTTGLVLLVKPKDLDTAVAAVEKQVVSDAGSESAVESETVKGTEVRSTSNDSGNGQAYAVVDDTIVLGTVPDDVTPFIRVGSGESIADSDAFQTASDRLPSDRAVFAFLNGQPFVDALATSQDANTQLAQDLLEQLGNLDVDQGIAVVADQPGLRVETVQVSRHDTATATASGTAADLTTAGKVPSDTLLYVNGFNLGQTSLLQGVSLLLVGALAGSLDNAPVGVGTPTSDEPVASPAASPAAESTDALFEAAAATLGVNLKTEFLDTLTGQYAFALWGVDVNDPTKIGAILASDVSNADALRGTVSFISLFVQAGAQGQASVSSRTVGDAEVNNVTLGDPAAPISVDYGIVHDQFLLGVGDGVDQYLTGPAASLADDATYQRTLGYLPSEYDGVFYVDVAALSDLSLALNGVTDGLTSQDASAECAAYDSQAEAQNAYDTDPSANFQLDLNFDGRACEDYFSSPAAGATPEASPVAGNSGLANVGSLAMVSYAQDGYAYTSSILTVGDQ